MKCWLNLAIACLLICFGATTMVQAAQYAVVAKRTIYPGQLISFENLKLIKLTREPTINYRFVSKRQEIVGTLAKRTILAERFIPVGSVQSAPLIKAGTPTRVAFQTGGLSISVVCVPLTDGVSGEYVCFRNPSSGKTFMAKINADGSVIASKL